MRKFYYRLIGSRMYSSGINPDRSSSGGAKETSVRKHLAAAKKETEESEPRQEAVSATVAELNQLTRPG